MEILLFFRLLLFSPPPPSGLGKGYNGGLRSLPFSSSALHYIFHTARPGGEKEERGENKNSTPPKLSPKLLRSTTNKKEREEQ